MAAPQNPEQQDVAQLRSNTIVGNNGMVQSARNMNEYQARSRAQYLLNSSQAFNNDQNYRQMPELGEVREGMIKAVWLDDCLVLARRVNVGGREYVQGAWLDWEAIRQWLLHEVSDLLPQAQLVPALGSATGDAPERLVAALPIRLVPGTVPTQVATGPSPMIFSLGVAWTGAALAALAVGLLLWKAVALSERRAAFVSAVTHELRTPLTTFRMYSEMLAGDMVPDQAKQRRYLETLHVEADRLTNLVENVLSYARLERKPLRRRLEPVTLEDLVGRLGARLAERARQADMELVTEVSPAAGAARVMADPSAAEQILFNLVDNACKYAARAADRRIHLAADVVGRRARLAVCDHGPGIAPAEARRLFRPFTKSARDAANSAPGVGLGLALSRRLAREMGGDLVIEHGPAADGANRVVGACLVLMLPVA
jgi:signal transduction histidine kinase